MEGAAEGVSVFRRLEHRQTQVEHKENGVLLFFQQQLVFICVWPCPQASGAVYVSLTYHDHANWSSNWYAGLAGIIMRARI